MRIMMKAITSLHNPPVLSCFVAFWVCLFPFYLKSVFLGLQLFPNLQKPN